MRHRVACISLVSPPVSLRTKRVAIVAVKTEMKPMPTSMTMMPMIRPGDGLRVEVAVADGRDRHHAPLDADPATRELACVEAADLRYRDA